MSREEVGRELGALEGWRLEGDRIVKIYRFKTFMAGVEFVNRVAELAEEADHHPDIYISWRRVTLSLTTHDEGGLTEKDFELARRIDSLLKTLKRPS